MPDPDTTKSWGRKVADGVAAWIGPACILGILLLANFLYNLKSDVKVIHDIKITVDEIKDDSSALWGTTAEQNAKIERLEATIEILEKLVIYPANRVGLIEDHEMVKKPKVVKEEDIDDYMLEQRTKYAAPDN